MGKHTERLSPTPHVREGLTQDEEWLKSMVDHPAGRRCHGDEEELDMAQEKYEILPGENKPQQLLV